MITHLQTQHAPSTEPRPYSRQGATSVIDIRRGRVTQLARMIEPDESRLAEWLRETPIAEFDGLTAHALLAAGTSYLIEDFLLAILTGERG